MRITLNLPDNLISEVKKLSNSKTKNDVIIYALKYFIQHEKIKKIKKFKGKIKLDIDINALRDR